MQLGHYLDLLTRAQQRLGAAFDQVSAEHADEADVRDICRWMAQQCAEHSAALAPLARAYPVDGAGAPQRLHSELFGGPRSGPLGLLRDLHDLYLMATEVQLCATLLGQAGQAARDQRLTALAQRGEAGSSRQLSWLRTRMKQAAPQALVVAD
jgi:hypothetical protein